MDATILYPSPLGDIRLTVRGGALAEAHFCRPGDPAPVCREDPLLDQAARWLDRYFAGDRPGPGAIPLAPAGTPFQRAVWQLLREIDYGQSTTYGALARTLMQRQGLSAMSAQAIGGAVGRNPIAVFIPCHRVLGKNGQLTGYAAGLDRKEYLLRLEQIPFS